MFKWQAVTHTSIESSPEFRRQKSSSCNTTRKDSTDVHKLKFKVPDMQVGLRALFQTVSFVDKDDKYTMVGKL